MTLIKLGITIATLPIVLFVLAHVISWISTMHDGGSGSNLCGGSGDISDGACETIMLLMIPYWLMSANALYIILGASSLLSLAALSAPVQYANRRVMTHYLCKP